MDYLFSLIIARAYDATWGFRRVTKGDGARTVGVALYFGYYFVAVHVG